MFKEINDAMEVCRNMSIKSDEIKNYCSRIDGMMKEVQSGIGQEEMVNVTLAIRKELANLFILNSNIEGCLESLKKSADSLKKILRS
jgi:hypothetical protein